MKIFLNIKKNYQNAKELKKQVKKTDYEQRQYSNLEFLYANKKNNEKGENNG